MLTGVSLQFMQSANSLLDNITAELFTKQPTHLLLAFGPTASRPSEVYSLAFPAVGKMLLHAAKCCCGQLPSKHDIRHGSCYFRALFNGNATESNG